MDVLEAMQQRKSIRGYRPDPVPKEILAAILKAAARAPSGVNIQPWEFTVISGEMQKKVAKANVEKFVSGAAGEPDLPSETYEGIYRERQVDLAVRLFKLMGIEREDRLKRIEWIKRGYRFFDAPASIIISMDRTLSTGTWFDLGLVTQNICLAAMKYDLGTCIIAQGVSYPEVIREYTGIPRSKQLVIAVCIGYPDWTFPANQLESPREDYENLTQWIGFD